MNSPINDPFRLIKSISLLVVVLFLALFFIFNYDMFFESPEEIVKSVKSLGALGPVIFILLIILEVVIAPIPGAVIPIATGFAYGAFWGTLICYTGNILGTMLAFSIARHFGRGVVEKFVKRKKLDLYDSFIHHEGKFIFLFAYVIPVLPPDIVSFIAGLSSIRFRTFFLFVAIGYLPYMLALNLFGQRIFESGFDTRTILMGTGFILLTLTGLITYFIIRRKKYGQEKEKS